MQSEEQVTCRICSAPAEPDQPLFHPCKCSGTIRYIHQDCLTTWLAHSKKKTCDICKHPYSFTKVYAVDMPDRLPILLLIRQLSRQGIMALIFCARAILVGMIWLAVLPWATIWTWRMYFAMGESTAWWISNRPRPIIERETSFNVSSNSTMHTTPENATLPASLFSHPVVRAVGSDIVSGQIIASLIVLAFVAIFLLREWISQNARPGVFEDGDAIPPPELVPPLRVQLPRPAPPAQVPAAEIPHAEHPVNRFPEQNIRQRHVPREIVAGDVAHGAPHKRPRREVDPDEILARRRRTPRRGKGKGVDRRPLVDIDLLPEDPDQVRFERAKEWNQKIREMMNSPRIREMEARAAERSNLQGMRDRIRAAAEKRQADARASRASLDISPEQAEFTFVPTSIPSGGSAPATPEVSRNLGLAADVPPRPRSANPDVPEDITSSLSPTDEQPSEPLFEESITLDEQTFDPSLLSTAISSLSASKPEIVDAPEEDTMALTVPSPAENHIANTSAEEASTSVAFSEPSTSTDISGLRRPQLPSVTLPPSSGVSPTASVSRSRGPTPLASPNLATYRPPEEFEAGPSTLRDYFDGDEYLSADEQEDLEAKRRRYFVDLDEEIEHDADGDVQDEDPDGYAESRWSEEANVGIEDDQEEDDPYLEEMRRAEAIGPDDDPPPVEIAPPPVAQPLQVDLAPMQDNAIEVIPPELNQDLDANLEDDMDGALEAIGLRGPLFGVVQNAALMIFILDATIGLGVWLPFTIGKSAALLSLEPRRMLQLAHMPLRLIRLVTDPIVDGVLLFVTRMMVPPVLHLLQFVTNMGLYALGALIGHQSSEKLSRMAMNVYNHSASAVQEWGPQASAWLAPKATSLEQSPPSPSFISRFMEDDSSAMRFIEPYFAPLGSKLRFGAAEAKVTWLRLAVGNGADEKAFAIGLGYVMISLMLALYLNVLTVGNMKHAGRAVRSAVRQQLLVVKVAAFIIVELVVFPLGCGIMLDACSVWLLPQGNARARAAFLLYAPVTSIFYHWVIGTMFMYQFAVLLAGCRGIMRSGAMWFIKDPQDQNFHPIRDILERPTLVQVRKLLLSAVMYGFVVAAGVGTVSGILQLFSKTILPFRWKTLEPISVVPIDLLFLHLVLPYTMQSFRPKKAIKTFGTALWKYLAAQLRLMSYMFGGRHPMEEFTPKRFRWKSLLPGHEVVVLRSEMNPDGSLRRVPNSDNVALVKDSPATVLLNRDGQPKDEEQRKLMLLQNAEAIKAKRNIKDDYVIVYLPPNLKYRVAAFILAVWTVGSMALALTLGAPILLGRGFLKLFKSEEVHDGYSFITGFYLLWACWLVGNAIDRLDKRRQRRGGDEPRAEWPLYLAKRSLLWFAQISYMAFFLGVVIPTLLALAIEFYIVMPIRQLIDPAALPRIRIVDMWALGLLYCKIMIRCLRMQRDNDFVQGIDHIKRMGLTHPDPFRATKEVIAPVTFGLMGMLLLPAGSLYALRRVFKLPISDDFLFVHVYPSIFAVAGCSHAVFSLSHLLSLWMHTIRDKEFLVEMRLQNLDLDLEQEKEEPADGVDREVQIEEDDVEE